jgi:hypothetical protein
VNCVQRASSKSDTSIVFARCESQYLKAENLAVPHERRAIARRCKCFQAPARVRAAQRRANAGRLARAPLWLHGAARLGLLHNDSATPNTREKYRIR